MIKIEELKAICGDDDSMVEMLLNLYMEEYGQCDSIIQQRYSNDDLDGLFKIAHELKGMFSNLCAQDAMSLAQAIEASSQVGTLPEESTIDNLCQEIRAINQQIKTIVA